MPYFDDPGRDMADRDFEERNYTDDDNRRYTDDLDNEYDDFDDDGGYFSYPGFYEDY